LFHFVYFVGAAMRTVSEENVGEKAGTHYPCFGQRRAFFASERRKYPIGIAAKTWPVVPERGTRQNPKLLN
jgi:hypothetical protein